MMLDTPIHLPGAGSTWINCRFFSQSLGVRLQGLCAPFQLGLTLLQILHEYATFNPRCLPQKHTHLYYKYTYIYIYTINVQYHTDMVAPRTSLFIRIDIF